MSPLFHTLYMQLQFGKYNNRVAYQWQFRLITCWWDINYVESIVDKYHNYKTFYLSGYIKMSIPNLQKTNYNGYLRKMMEENNERVWSTSHEEAIVDYTWRSHCIFTETTQLPISLLHHIHLAVKINSEIHQWLLWVYWPHGFDDHFLGHNSSLTESFAIGVAPYPHHFIRC
jgi:hypothetical protein